MRELIDCHIHTERCGHASGTVAQMISAAVFGGLAGVVMTEHLPLPDDLDPGRRLSMHPDDIETYAAEVLQMAERVKGLTVVLGAEADWLPGREAEAAATRERARQAGVAVLLGSVHFLSGSEASDAGGPAEWAFDDPAEIATWESRDVDAVWDEYFQRWCAAARSGLFEVMSHPDLPKKFGHRPLLDPSDWYAEAARAAAESGVLVEVSTAGLRKPVGELYPGPDLLAAFRAAGVEATVGSDAHSTAEVGSRIADAYDAVVAAGYARVALPISRDERRYVEL